MSKERRPPPRLARLRVALLSLALCAPSAPTLAQEQPTAGAPQFELRSLIGQALDPEGRPVADAEVTVCWRPRGNAQLAATEWATGRSSRRGYFAVKAPVGVPLQAWFVGPADAAGKAWVSAAASCTTSTQRFLLRAAGRSSAERIKLQGLEPWRDLGPFTVLLHQLNGQGPVTELEIDADDAVTVPALHWTRAYLELRDAAGQPLEVAATTDRGQPRKVTLTAPREIPVLVVAEDDTPVADVELSYRVENIWPHDSPLLEHEVRAVWRRSGVSDAQGRAMLRLPLAKDPFAESTGYSAIVLRASKPGFAETHSGWQEEMFVDGKRLGAEGAAKESRLRFVMRPEQPVTGRFSLPAADRPTSVLVRWTSKIGMENGWMHLPRSAVAVVARDGTLALPALPLDAYELRFSVGPLRWAPDGAASRWLPAALSPVATRPQAVLDLTPGGLFPARAKVTDAEGEPVLDGRVAAIAVSDDSVDLDDVDPVCPLDHVGTAELLLPAGRWMLVSASSEGYAIGTPFDVATQAKDVELQYQPWDEMHGVVRDEDGKPVADARISIRSTSMRGMVASFEQRLRTGLAELAERNFCAPTTDAEGRFVMRFLDLPGRSCQAVAQLGRKTGERFTILADDTPVEIVLR